MRLGNEILTFFGGLKVSEKKVMQEWWICNGNPIGFDNENHTKFIIDLSTCAKGVVLYLWRQKVYVSGSVFWQVQGGGIGCSTVFTASRSRKAHSTAYCGDDVAQDVQRQSTGWGKIGWLDAASVLLITGYFGGLIVFFIFGNRSVCDGGIHYNSYDSMIRVFDF